MTDHALQDTTGRQAARDRRALALGIVVVVTLILTARILPAWREWRYQTRTVLSDSMSELADTRTVVGRRQATMDSLRARQARVAAYGDLLLGKDGPTAVSVLGDVFADAAAAAGVSASGVQVEAVPTRRVTMPTDRLLRIRLRASVSGTSGELATLLARLEAPPPLLDVRELTIDQRDVHLPGDVPEQLRATIVVVGLAGQLQGAHTPTAAGTSDHGSSRSSPRSTHDSIPAHDGSPSSMDTPARSTARARAGAIPDSETEGRL